MALVLLALGGSARAQVDQNYLEQWLKSSSNNALSATQRTQAEFTTPAHVWNVSRSDNGSVQVVRSPEQWYTLVRLGGELKFVLLINATDAKTTAVQIADAALARSLASLGTGQYPVYEAQDTAWYQLEDSGKRKLRQAVIETPAKGRARPQVSVHSATAVPASQTAAAIEKTKTEKE